MKSTTVRGYEIPEGVTVQPDVYSLHYNPEFWGEDPTKFDPER